MHKRFLGFSLIELMIVVSIIGILAMIGIPSYQHYTERARFAEVIAATEPFKIAVAMALQSGVISTEIANGVHGIPSQPKNTKNLSEITVEKSVITAIGTSLAGDATYILKPNQDGSIWTVSGSCLKSGLCNA